MLLGQIFKCLSLRIEIAKRVRSITEIKYHIGHSWNKVYKDKIKEKYFLFFHLIQ